MKIKRIINRLNKDHGYLVEFVPVIQNEDGLEVDALICKYEGNISVLISNSSTKDVLYLLIHEITHDLINDEFFRLFNTIDEELIANISGLILGNEKFLRELFKNKYKLKNDFITNLKDIWIRSYYSGVSHLKETKYHLSENALKDVSSIVTETKENAKINPDRLVKLKNKTMSILVNNGVNNKPMYSTRSHVRENILTETEAIKLGYSIKNKHYHGLGVKKYLETIDLLDKPLGVYQYINSSKYNKDNFIVLSSVKLNGKNIIVPIEINKSGQYNNKTVYYNKIKTVYAKDNSNYIKELLNNGIIKEIFDGSNSRKKSPCANNIPYFIDNVNEFGRNFMECITFINPEYNEEDFIILN